MPCKQLAILPKLAVDDNQGSNLTPTGPHSKVSGTHNNPSPLKQH